jgi:fermentation-respiration switch protein FrsA (DUF1100 family)
MLLDHGYGVLLVDGRGAGRSEGRPMALGWTDESDVAAAVSFLADRADVDPLRIGLLGLSLGAEQAITEAASDARVRAVVAEGAGIHSFGDTYSLSGGAEKVVAVVQTWFSMRTVETLSGLTPPPPIEQSIGHVAPRPVLLISGSDRQEQQLNRAYDDAGGATTELWEVPDAPHTHALHTHPSEYERRVVGFFAAALGA